MIMKYRIVKLDARHANRNLYRYVIEFGRHSFTGYSTGVLSFHQALQWFNRTWGFSVEVNLQQELVKDAVASKGRSDAVDHNDLNLHWAYSSKYRDFRIYVRSEEELALFELVHAGT